MKEMFKIRVLGNKGNQSKIDSRRFSEASRQYKATLSALDSAEREEYDFLDAKYARALGRRKMRYEEANLEVKKFNRSWGKRLADYYRDLKRVFKVSKKMRKDCVPFEDVEAFIADQQNLINEKYRDVLEDYKSAVEESQPVLDSFRAKWEQNADIISYYEERSAAQVKYKNLRTMLEYPDITEFVIPEN